MVKQYDEGFFVNGKWHSGRYMSETDRTVIVMPDDVFDKHTRPININNYESTIGCSCGCGELEEPTYNHLLIVGILVCITALLAFMIGVSL